MSSYTVAFFGATGGCTNACLTHLLLSNDASAQYKAIALARTPSKLIESLKKQPGVTDAIIAQKLTIVQGDGTNTADVKKTLLYQAQNASPKLVDAVVSGIGAAPVRKPGTLMTITMSNTTITEEFSNAFLTSLREIYSEHKEITHKPVLTVISTTGLDSPKGAKQDVPFGYRTLYHWVLKTAHDDKRKMEETLTDVNEKEALLQGLVIARPTLLTSDGIVRPDASKRTVRAGTEFKPVTGYFMAREDVGGWIWSNVLSSEDHGKPWYGRRVSLAY